MLSLLLCVCFCVTPPPTERARAVLIGRYLAGWQSTTRQSCSRRSSWTGPKRRRWHQRKAASWYLSRRCRSRAAITRIMNLITQSHRHHRPICWFIKLWLTVSVSGQDSLFHTGTEDRIREHMSLCECWTKLHRETWISLSLPVVSGSQFYYL